MKHLIAISLVALFLFALGQAMFCPRPAASSSEAVILSTDMRRNEREHYLLEQARRFFRQGKFGDTFDLTLFARESLGLDSPEMAELFTKSREQLEENALIEAEKLQQNVRETLDLQ